jgi:hypothetical protein
LTAPVVATPPTPADTPSTPACKPFALNVPVVETRLPIPESPALLMGVKPSTLTMAAMPVFQLVTVVESLDTM